MKSLAVFVVLAVSQFLLRPTSVEPDEATLRSRFPGAVRSVVLGGFRPMVVQYLWWDLERSYDEGRYLEVLQTLGQLRQLEPDNTRAIWYLAHFLAYNLGAQEATPAGRLGRVVDAVDLLEEAEKRHADDVMLPLQRGTILMDERLWTEDLYRAYRRRTGRTPHEAAAAALGRALELAPGSPVLPVLLADSLRIQAISEFPDPGAATAAATLRRAVAAADRAPPSSATSLCRAWERVAAGLAQPSARVAGEGLEALASALGDVESPEEGGSGLEERLVVSILKPLLVLGKKAALEGPPDDALFLLIRLHSIQALLERRLASSREGGWNDPLIRPALREMAAEIIRRAPQLAQSVPDDLRR